MSLDINTYTDMIDDSEYYQVDVVDGKFKMESNLALDWLERRCTVIVLDKNSDQKMMLTPFDLNNGVSDNIFKKTYQGGRFARIEMDFIPENLPETEISKWLIALSKRFNYQWLNLLKHYLITEEFRNINKQANVIARKTKIIVPPKEQVYRVFNNRADTTRVVILSMDPYSNDNANGIAFGTDKSTKPVSLRALERAVAKDLEYPIDWQIQNDLLNVVKQGVLFLNSSLTTEFGVSGAHSQLWFPVMKEMVKVINDFKKPLIFLLLGKQAQAFEVYINGNKHSIFKLTHPASASYSGKEWNSEFVFKKINDILIDLGTPTIKW